MKQKKPTLYICILKTSTANDSLILQRYYKISLEIKDKLLRDLKNHIHKKFMRKKLFND